MYWIMIIEIKMHYATSLAIFTVSSLLFKWTLLNRQIEGDLI